MTDPGPASFSTQANALLIKNLTFQKRNMKANIRIILFPVILFTILAMAQHYINNANKAAAAAAAAAAAGEGGGGTNDDETSSCGKDYFSDASDESCEVSRPAEWPALLQIPSAQFRVVRNTTSNSSQFDTSCEMDGSCPVTLLVTGFNQTMAQSVANKFFPSNNPRPTQSSNDTLYMLANLLLGIVTDPGRDNYVESGFDRETVEALPQKTSFPEDQTSVSIQHIARLYNNAQTNQPLPFLISR